MNGINGKDLNDYLLNAKWIDKVGLELEFTQEVCPFVRTGKFITISNKSFLVTDCKFKDNSVLVNIRGLKFELIHFRRLNKCH